MSSEAKKGCLYMIPLPVAEGANHTLSPMVAAHTAEIRHYFVENVRTARRFIRSLHAKLVIEDIQFSEIDKRAGPDAKLLRTWLKEGKQVGVMSEAGCPGIADPGSALVTIAHSMGVQVVPLTGPSSILLALMASGLNGQSFAFNGYLPVKELERGKAIKEMEARSAKERQTQIFIETPYRNTHLLQDLLKHCAGGTHICIAQHITAANEFIRTKTVAEWKKEMPALAKEPAVFLMLG
jgi:16S rRNA (cytidine1402-2'-O)-methyltransferase